MVDVAGSVGGVVSPVLQVAEWLAAPIWRPFKYLYNYTTNFKNLETQVDELKKKREEVEHKIIAAERNMEAIYQNVKKWQDSAQKMIDKAEQLIQEKANNPRCFKGLCSNFIIHYKQSRKAFKLKRDDIDPLLQQELGTISYQTNPPEIWLGRNENYLAFESRNSMVNNVWHALNDENVYMIGVYGMGGLGKTTLVEELGRKAKKDDLFKEIVFVEVSESPDVKKIQTTIADKLGVKFKNESEMADKIYSRMKDENILLILDNIWEPLELDKKVGIPRRADRGRNKLLFTTRNLDVLKRMDSTNNFEMGILNEEEAWTLFTKMAGNIIQTRELDSLAKDVCKECKGLPIVICTIAKALKYKSPPHWKCAWQELKAPSPRKYTRYLEKDYAKIALSYKYLSDDELKKTFLISSLMKNNTSISDLFRHVVCLDVFDGANLTMEEARDKLDTLVCDLKDACLLLDGFESSQFAIHDVVRAVAITIAYVDHHVFTERNDVERDWKDRDKLKKCTKISLPDKSTIISQLWPNDLDCPNLEYFYMTNTWDSSFEIPEDFFRVMPKLRVLNLYGLGQSSLPSSIDRLTNLQTLCLDNSQVKDFAIIGKLKIIKVLSLQNLDIEEFPLQLGQLTQLRLLDLSWCWRLYVIAPNVISQLSKLEEFYIEGCPIKWKDEVLKELKLLSNLTSLKLDIEVNMLPKDFVSKKLRRYKITIRDKYYGDPISKYSRILAFSCNSTISQEELGGINNVEVLRIVKSLGDEEDLAEKQMLPLFDEKVIFTNLMVLELVNISFEKIWESQLSTPSYQNLTQLILKSCDKIKYVFPFFIAKSLQQLQYLNIAYCEVLEKIVEEEGKEVVDSIFPRLMELELKYLPKLNVFYFGADALELPMLKTLKIFYCSNFTSTYQGFQDNNKEGEVKVSESKSISLEHKINSDLEVFYFEDDVASITWESHSKTLETSVINLSMKLLQKFYNLKVLKVCRSLSKEIKSPFDLPYLEVLDIDGCYRLMSLPTFSTYFLHLKVLQLSCCHRLIRRLITPSMAKSLVHLREMSIYRCNLLTEVVEDEADATTTDIVFHNLEKLSLKKLDSLTCFCSGNYSFSFPTLKVLAIQGCLNMKTFCLGFLCTPRLHNVNYENKRVEIRENDLNASIQQAHKKRVNSDFSKLSLSGRDIISIWQDEFKENFDKAETLELIRDEYTHIPIHILVKFINLENLILKMSSYEEIFSYGEDEEHVGALAKLKKLKLQGLFNLKCIWKQDFQFKTILQNLHFLEVEYCHNLMTLLPPSSSFENLVALEVNYCNGLQNLMTSSTTKSLVRLKSLSIQRCKMMIEVLANDEDIENDEIVFEKLEGLLLFDLESLTGFGSGKYNLKFPSLESLLVSQCSKMKTFFEGGLNMPKLRLVNEKDCSSDLNWVTQQLQNDCSKLWEESARSYGQGAGETSYSCDYCNKDITGRIRMRCAICPYFDLCVECFSVGAEVTTHKSGHPYKVHGQSLIPTFML